MDGGGSTPKAGSKEEESNLAGTEQEDLSTKVRDLEIELTREREVAKGHMRKVDNLKADLRRTLGQLDESRAQCRQLTEALAGGTSRETGVRQAFCKVHITGPRKSLDGCLLLDRSGPEELKIRESVAQQVGLVRHSKRVSIPIDMIISAKGIPSEEAGPRGYARIDLSLGEGSEQSTRYNHPQPQNLEVWTEKKSLNTEFSNFQTLRVVCEKEWTPVKDPDTHSQAYLLIIGGKGMTKLGLELRPDGHVFQKRA
jgi:hypothetical protein